MPRLGLLNMCLGFIVVFFAASAGVFHALDLTTIWLQDPESAARGDWQRMLNASSHGHTNLFGYLQILTGLTMSWSALPVRVKVFQTAALLAGVLAMGPGMMIRASLGPTPSLDLTGIAIGTGLSAALVAVALQALGIGMKLVR